MKRVVAGACGILSVVSCLALSSGCTTRMVVGRDESGRPFRSFTKVWYSRMKTSPTIPVYDDRGKLIIWDDSLEFQGKKGQLLIQDVRKISLRNLHMTPFDFNTWVVVEYGVESDISTALFIDGRWLGWASVFGGTRNIFDAVRQSESYARPAGP